MQTSILKGTKSMLLNVYFRVFLCLFLAVALSSSLFFIKAYDSGDDAIQTQLPCLLTTEEKKWLQEHPTIHISAYPDNRDISYVNARDELVGFAPSYFSELAEILGVIVNKKVYHTRADALKALEKNEVNVLCGVKKTEKRKELFEFSGAITNSAYFLFRMKDRGIEDLSGMKNLTMATISSSARNAFLNVAYPEITLRPKDSIRECVKALLEKEVDGVVAPFYQVQEVLTERQMSLLEISFVEDKRFLSTLHFAVNGDEEILCNIINKAMCALPRRSLLQLEAEWLNGLWTSHKSVLSKYSFVNIFLISMILFLIFGIFCCFVYWIRVRVVERRRASADRVFASISHDIRNPLGTMKSMLDLYDQEENLTKKEEILDDVLKCSEVLFGLIDDANNEATYEGGNIELRPQEVDMESLIETIYAFYKLRPNKEVQFTCDKGVGKESLPQFVEIDPIRLQQVIMNLLSNAFKFTDKGIVTLVVKCLSSVEKIKNTYDIVLPELRGDEKLLLVSVKDSGIGIAKDKLQYIFQPFAQENDGETQRKHGGTGLGLSICKEICDLMNGHLLVDSVVGKGTIFTFLIPVKPLRKKSNRNQGVDL